MRRLFILIFISISTHLISISQNQSKYLENAVPVIDGKVAFKDEVNAPNFTLNDLYDIVTNWAQNNFNQKSSEKKYPNFFIAYTNKKDGIIAIKVEDYIVFSSTVLSLDRTKIDYLLIINCLNGKLKISMKRINYLYDEYRNGGERYKAEELITDKYALNKAKTRLYPINGKFRRKTIDYYNDLLKSIRNAIDRKIIDDNEKKNVININQEKEVNDLGKQKKSSTTEEIINSSDKISISAGNNESIELNKSSWAGFGDILGKKVTFIIIEKKKNISNMLLNDNENYNISFFMNTSSSPSLIIKCKKLLKKDLTVNEIKKMNITVKENSDYNLYIGEIVE